MANQPTPTVDARDVERIVRRDFPLDVVETVLSLIAGLEEWEHSRVALACLKLAGGNLDRLRGAVANASADYREVLLEAEYPLAAKRWFRMEKLSDDERQAIYDSDWRQYSEWLARA